MLRAGMVPAVVAALLSACGGGGSGGVDAGGPGDGGGGGPDAGPGGACAEFDDPAHAVSDYPVTVDGTLAEAGAEHAVGAGSCDQEEAPYGVEAPGPDQVIELDDLTPGGEYAVRLFGGADLALYIAGGCGESGPEDCLLYVDATTTSPELAVFRAPDDGRAFVVIDYFLPSTPQEAGFSLEVYPAECAGDDACGGESPFCVDRRCVACVNSFDCQGTDEPVCDPRQNQCRPGGDLCNNDDPSPPEGGDDGPAGALVVTPALGGSTTQDAAVCNDPTEELDYYTFTVDSGGEGYTITLDWDAPEADLDLRVQGEDGALFGASLWDQPEQVALTHLAAGTYFVSVDLFGPVEAVSLPYSLELVRVDGPGCQNVSDCAAQYDNQVFRGQCTGGACRFLEGGGALEDGALCDSGSDCASGRCTAFLFNADADSRAICTHACTEHADCSDLGSGFLCTDYLVDNVCVAPCAIDEHCPAVLGASPDQPPWDYLTCEPATGECSL